MPRPRSAHVFCQVVDNFGDAGVCWRLARALAALGLEVTLWMDDLARLKQLRPRIDLAQGLQPLDGFRCGHWDQANGPLPELVVAGFGCRLPPAYLAEMAAAPRPPVWINLDYLSAEAWVEGSHGLPSPHPNLPLTEYFYFPGFTPRTGGLLREASWDAVPALDGVEAMASDARRQLLRSLNLHLPDQTLLVSLFCYPTAPIRTLFEAMADGRPVVCLVPAGVTPLAPEPGQMWAQGSLSVYGIPFLEPDAYDALLRACDLNFVRGEDSAVRAQWAARPFVWQLYPQTEDTHLKKLDAFLALYEQGLERNVARSNAAFMHAWNGQEGAALNWKQLMQNLATLGQHGQVWAGQLAAQTELAQGLVEFASKIG